MIKITAMAMLASLLIVPVTAQAGERTKVSVLWQNFPKGTACTATGIKGKLKLGKKRGHPKVDVKGHGEIGTFFCTLPDGRRVKTDVNRRLPAATRVAGITVYPDGRTYLTASTSDGLVSQSFANTLSLMK